MVSKDKAPPSLVLASPKKGESAIAVNQDFVLMFNQNIQIGSGNIVISNQTGDTQTISLSSCDLNGF